MVEIYSAHADVCARFYSLTLDPEETANFVLKNSKALPGQKALFVGGMFDVAKCLKDSGLDITLVDYTDEMVAIGKTRLSGSPVFKADLRNLPFSNEFDIVYVIGRVFTHMISDDDLKKALLGCWTSLGKDGYLFADNYEDSRIQMTNYFNGRIECEDSDYKIIRNSSTTRISDSPMIVKWDANYSGHMNGNDFDFSDSMEHRAFSRYEFASALQNTNFSVEQQGNNFDETSFFTLAKKAV